MELAVYSRHEPLDTVVLTPVIFSPPLEAQHAYGPLVLRGAVDTGGAPADFDWERILLDIDLHGYAALPCAAGLSLLALR